MGLGFVQEQVKGCWNVQNLEFHIPFNKAYTNMEENDAQHQSF